MVTACFVDIKGSTELLEDLHPDEARAIVDSALRFKWMPYATTTGMSCNQLTMGFLRYSARRSPIEDHPQRALYAALRTQNEIHRYGDKLLSAAACPLRFESA
jgi:hypothetical protein